MAFDQAIADQLTQLSLLGVQNCQQLNGAMDRNLVANAASTLTLGTQLAGLAGLNMQTAIDPLEGAAASNVRASQDATYIAGVNTASRAPGRQF